MTTALRILTVLALAAALSACGLLRGLIPDQSLTDPFGLDGVDVTLGADEAAASALDAAASTTLVGTIDASFDVEDNDIPSWISDVLRIRSVSGDVGIAPLVTLDAPEGAALPQALSIVAANHEFAVSSGGSRRFGGAWSADGLTVLLSASEPCDASCTYTVTPQDQALLTMLMTGSEARAYGQVIAAPGSYDLDGQVVLEVDAELPAGTEMRIELRDFGGVVSF